MGDWGDSGNAELKMGILGSSLVAKRYLITVFVQGTVVMVTFESVQGVFVLC